MKKFLISSFLGLSIMMPLFTHADLIQDLQAQIIALRVQIAKLQQISSQQGTVVSPPVLGFSGSGGGSGQAIANFDQDLYIGLKNNDDVRDLQEFLTEQGYYAGPISGNYGLLTFQSVKKFQSVNGLKSTGYFGPKARGIANGIIQKLVGSVCGEDGCERDVLPPRQLVISTNSDLRGTVGNYFSATFAVSGGSGDYATGYEANLESSGLAISGVADRGSATFILSGTPKKAGVYTIVLTASDNSASSPAYGKERFTIVITDATSVSQPPVIQGIKGPTTLKAGEEGLWTVNAYDTGNGSLSYSVVWGDEKNYVGEAMRAPQATQFIQTATFSHTYWYSGVYTPIFTVVNNSGQGAKTSISVQVSGGTTVQNGSLYIEPANVSVQVGQTIKVQALYQPPMPPCNIPGVFCAQVMPAPFPVVAVWTSSNPAVASVFPGTGAPCPVGSACPTSPVPGAIINGNSSGVAEIKAVYTLPSGAILIAKTNVTVTAGTTQPSITVISPNGGEVWQLNSSHTILWKPYDPTAGINPALSEVNAYLEKLVDGSYVVVGKVLPAGKASIHWQGEIDTFGKYPAPGDYYIRVVNSRTGFSDRSDKTFKLVAEGTITADLKVSGLDGPITVPSGGGDYTLRWKSNAESCAIYFWEKVEALLNLSPVGERVVRLPANITPYQQYINLVCTSKVQMEGNASDYVMVSPGVSMSIVTPNGGETVNWSAPYVINWRHSNIFSKFSIALYKNDSFFAWIVTDLPVGGESGAYSWTPSQTFPQSIATNDGNVFKIYIIGYKTAGGTVEDKSDAPFSIVTGPTQPSITVISPNGGEILKTGEIYTIRWNSSNVPSTENVKIELGYNQTDPTYPGGAYNEEWIVEKTLNSGSYIWKVPEAYGMGMKESAFQIKVSTASGLVDYSDSNFTIKLGVSNPTLNVSSPVTGASYANGQTATIKWTPFDASESVRFTLLRKGDASFSRRIVSAYDNGLQSWTWPVPTGLSGNDYFLRAETHRNASPYGIGYGGTFSIVASTTQPSITVLSPNGGEQWVLGTTKNITWSLNGYSQNQTVKLELRDAATKELVGVICTSCVPSTLAWIVGNLQDANGNFFKASPGQYLVHALPIGYSLGDMGDAPFSIVSGSIPIPSFSVVAPTTILAAGSVQTIKWSSSNYPSTATVLVELYQDQSPVSSGPPQLTPYLSLRVPNNGSTKWTIPASILQAPNYHISVTCDEAGLKSYGSCSGGMSQAFGIVSAPQTTSLLVTPTTAPAGSSVTVTWSVASPTAKDWIGLFQLGSENTANSSWVYANGCSRTPSGSAAAVGSCSFVLRRETGAETPPSTLSPGSYEFRLFANDSFTLLATSPRVTVAAPGVGVIPQNPALASALSAIQAQLDEIKKKVQELVR